MNNNIEKPFERSRIRQIIGLEYHILKRKYNWYTRDKNWAKTKTKSNNGYSIFKHKSLILRPLKEVEMYLQENKRTNLRLAIKHLNDINIKPGETFSIWKLIGRPTKRKGYLEGLVLKQGQVDKGTAGGLCQLGNLLFWVFGHSPLTITERYRHSFDVFPDVNRTIPFGAGATLSYNHIDLQVKNETKRTFNLKLWLDETHLHGELFSSEEPTSVFHIEERNHIMEQQSWGGYSRHNQIFQIETNKHQVKTEKLLVENHAIMMYSPFLKGTEDK